MAEKELSQYPAISQIGSGTKLAVIEGGRNAQVPAAVLGEFVDGQIEASGLPEEIDALKAGQQTSAIYANTLVELQAVGGAYVGQGAFVSNGNGAGQYRWTGSAWEFLRADMLKEKADKADVVAANRTLAQMGAAQTYGRQSIGIGDGISAAGNTVVDRKGFTVAGQLAEIRVYARVAGAAQLKIVSRANTGALEGTVIASYPVNLSVGMNRLRAAIDFPEVAVQAGWSWGIYTATGMLARQSGSSNLAMSVAGDVSGASTWVNTANAPQWQADLVTGPAVKETASKADERANVALGAAVSTAIAGFALDGGTAFTNPHGTRIIHYALPYPAVVKRVTFISDGNTGFGYLKFLRKNAGDFLPSYTVESDHFFLPVTGRNDLVAGVDFPDGLVIPRGGAVGVYLSAQGLAYSAASAGGSLTITSNITGSATYVASSAQCHVEVELQYDFGQLPQGRLLIDETLASFDSVHASKGVWNFDGQGVLSPNGGDAVLHRAEYSVLDPSATSIKFRIVDAGSVFGVVKRAHEDQGSAFGTVAMFDQQSQQLQMMLWSRWDLAIPAEPARFVSVPFTFEVGDEGVLELKHVGAVNTATLTKSKTRESVTLAHTSAGDSATGRCWGQPGLVVRSGRTRFLGLQYRLLASRRPRLVCGVDSITEGFNLGSSSWGQRWGNLLRDENAIEVVFAARGGGNTVDLLRRATLDIAALRPDFYSLLCITNERNEAPIGNVVAWKARMQMIVAAIRASGATPILMTAPPTGDAADAAFINSANGLILAGAFGPARVVDFAAALTVNGDRVSQDVSLFLEDLVHPNVAGHRRMADQFVADVPELID